MDVENHLCSSCSLIDFDALFGQEIKCYELGTLATIAQRKSCPFCRFVVQVVDIVWARWKDEVWGSSLATSINVWVKTTLWAHYGENSKSILLSGPYNPYTSSQPHFRYRPSLGTDWEPDNRQRSSYGSPRYTLYELDRIQGSAGFKYFADDLGQDIRQVLSRRRIPSMVDRDLLKTWIHECQTNHPHCITAKGIRQAPLRSTGRFRVIDVETNTLFVPSQDITYIAVSYVWGGILQAKTDSERVEWIESLFDRAPSMKSTEAASPELDYRLRVENLPFTIQDSIKLTKLMGWRYIWIDLLCIRQNDMADKEALVKKMHLIYEEASFTIVAAGGQDANARLPGLFTPRHPEPISEIAFRSKAMVMAPARPTLPDLLTETVWASRGWTFQEDVLSRCCLYFTATEVFYSCRTNLPEYYLPRLGDYYGFYIGRYSEWRESYVLETKLLNTAYQHTSSWKDGWRRRGNASPSLRSRASVLGSNIPTDLNPDTDYIDWSEEGSSSVFDILQREAKNGKLFDEYAIFVAEYSKRHLSNTSDVVGAMMGILNKFNVVSVTSANIEAHGILGDHFEKGLLWVPLKETSLQRRAGFPSWSWAGWVGPVSYEIVHTVRFNTVEWTFRPPSPSVKMGALTMKSLLDIHIDTGHCMIAIVKRSKLPIMRSTYPPPGTMSNVGSPSLLRLYTYVARVSSITLETSFVVREHAVSMDVPMLLVRFRKDGEPTAVILDSRPVGTSAPLAEDCEKYRLAIIGMGQRNHMMDNGPDEYVVLLLEKVGESFERVGLATVPAERVELAPGLAEKTTTKGQSVLSKASSLFGRILSKEPEDEALIDPAPAWSLQWISLS
ncbi:HET-domain-containing protein [Fusarium austroafricanum]|uniref:HET-domain-containing protein n=1 Tax=Fusarium austroafricanum TaxID=2364996 RepID=A0A8H4JY75_9HYPO|nr:HET-domain-containing protein [Fusarium austroafricanum]